MLYKQAVDAVRACEVAEPGTQEYDQLEAEAAKLRQASKDGKPLKTRSLPDALNAVERLAAKVRKAYGLKKYAPRIFEGMRMLAASVAHFREVAIAADRANTPAGHTKAEWEYVTKWLENPVDYSLDQMEPDVAKAAKWLRHTTDLLEQAGLQRAKFGQWPDSRIAANVGEIEKLQKNIDDFIADEHQTGKDHQRAIANREASIAEI